MRRRYVQAALAKLCFAADKMAFVCGPRQCGKTTLGKLLLAERDRGRYLTWDDIELRRLWVKSPRQTAHFPLGEAHRRSARSSKPLVVYDEIHKAKGWKRTLKGIYDTREQPCDMLVTGSARLDLYRRGGDSLMGRYFRFRLHPFSLGEIAETSAPSPEAALRQVFRRRPPAGQRRACAEIWDDLFRFGGFPEPFLRGSMRFWRLWRRGRVEKIVREDLRDLSRLPELSQIEMLAALLPERAGGRLSVQSLREDLEVAHSTVSRWLGYLRELYYHYEVKPFATRIPRSLRKDSKLYLWDWSEVREPGPRFENLVASHLLKACHFWTDSGHGDFALHYLRDKRQRELDFLVTRDRTPWLVVECKLASTATTPGFAAFLSHLGNPPALQVVATPDVCQPFRAGRARGLVVSAVELLALLP